MEMITEYYCSLAVTARMTAKRDHISVHTVPGGSLSDAFSVPYVCVPYPTNATAPPTTAVRAAVVAFAVDKVK